MLADFYDVVASHEAVLLGTGTLQDHTLVGVKGLARLERVDPHAPVFEPVVPALKVFYNHYVLHCLTLVVSTRALHPRWM